ncbi:hypothetical protein CIL05_04575 [Virgibacillus profundi]|uniref:Carboxyltransferase domain-containing protein n=2 Tax=Virgibacillus profundi TaxID=2024555 RepID=A0A2A2IJ02_9BACI|nr:hypothetical protein CIL05_04575 [Virgibacillus profundi]PXY55257.1 allophanate hydrolase subunit 1 [Virgibacillus profundi]
MQAVGDSAVKVNFTGRVTPELNTAIQSFCHKLEQVLIDGVIEWVPAFDSVTIYYQPQKLVYKEITEKINDLFEMPAVQNERSSRTIQVPVLYGGLYAPDLERVAEYNGLNVNDVIRIHQEKEYLVYMLGFLPGFPYLGGLDKRIATPRLEEPRAKTFAGAVGIAHEQTGIYPVESPGGWNIIGKTPLELFDQDKFLFRLGDHIQFYSVEENVFAQIKEQIRNDTFKMIITEG